VTDAAIAVRVRGFEPLLDKSKIFVFIERLVVVAVGGGEFFAAQTAAQFFEVERAVLVGVESGESVACGLLGLGKVHRVVVVAIETLHRGRLVTFRESRARRSDHTDGGTRENFASRNHWISSLERFGRKLAITSQPGKFGTSIVRQERVESPSRQMLSDRRTSNLSPRWQRPRPPRS